MTNKTSLKTVEEFLYQEGISETDVEKLMDDLIKASQNELIEMNDCSIQR